MALLISGKDVMWFCDGCGDSLNMQEGYTDTQGKWKCTICGFENIISDEEILDELEY